jgi:hypothetical protein
MKIMHKYGKLVKKSNKDMSVNLDKIGKRNRMLFWKAQRNEQ